MDYNFIKKNIADLIGLKYTGGILPHFGGNGKNNTYFKIKSVDNINNEIYMSYTFFNNDNEYEKIYQREINTFIDMLNESRIVFLNDDGKKLYRKYKISNLLK